MKSVEELIKEKHEEACKNKQFWYIDPETGLKVLTRYFLEKREYCCKSFCRHCPYDFNDREQENEHKADKKG